MVQDNSLFGLMIPLLQLSISSLPVQKSGQGVDICSTVSRSGQSPRRHRDAAWDGSLEASLRFAPAGGHLKKTGLLSLAHQVQFPPWLWVTVRKARASPPSGGSEAEGLPPRFCPALPGGQACRLLQDTDSEKPGKPWGTVLSRLFGVILTRLQAFGLYDMRWVSAGGKRPG